MSDLSMSSGLSLRDLSGILLRRRGLILTTAVVFTTLICVGVLLVSFQYTAKALLEIEAQQSGLIGGQAGIFGQPADEPSLQTEMTALTSQDHERQVLDSLSHDPTFRRAEVKMESEAAASRRTSWAASVAWLRRAWLRAIGASGELTLQQLERHLNVYQERGSHAIAVAYTSPSADEAALIANRVAELYVERRGDQKRASTDRALAWLGERLPQVKDDVDRLETAAQAYRASHSLEDTKRTGVTDQQLTDLHKQLSAAETDLATRRARLENIRKLVDAGSIGDVIDQLGSPLLVALHRQELTLLQAQAAERATSFSENQPKLMQVRSQLHEVRQQISVEVNRALNSLMSETALATTVVQLIQQRLTTLESASSDMRLRTLERDAASGRQQYETLLQRREELYQQRQSLSAGVHILSLAWPPTRPSSANPLLFVPPALISSLIVGSLLALVKERLDTTFRSERDVISAVGVPCLGLVPELRNLGGKRPHDFLRGSPFDPYTEAIRSLVAALQLKTLKRTPKTILISSSVPGEGKTTLAVSFAAYAALIGNRVLLLDLDFRHPEILRELGGTTDKSLLDIIQSKSPTADLIQYSPSLQFEYMPISRLPVDPLTAFTNGHMSRLLLQLREKYDCVIIDSAPLLAVTETRVLAQMVDKVVLVVKWGSTRRDVVRNALGLLRSPGLLDKDQPDPVSVVITNVDLKKHARYRYGDSGEILMKYKKYYTQTTQ
ncbi:MAG: polysaccharide biosynthesis tyrosine autokinase [Rhodopila sp.]|nr:polysaccharide biosynthesis tyrosine autokinase [Rhodopila sp.]